MENYKLLIIRRIVYFVLFLASLYIAFCIGFGVCMERVNRLSPGSVYAYDTPEKIRSYYESVEKDTIQRTGLKPNDPVLQELLINFKEKKLLPLVTAGPVTVFFSKASGDYFIRENNSRNILVEWSSKRNTLYLNSKVEKDWLCPRTTYAIRYSNEGVFEQCSLFFNGKDGKFVRFYSDITGDGAFDRMDTMENGTRTKYSFDGLPYKEIEKVPHSSKLKEEKDYEDTLKKVKELFHNEKLEKEEENK